MNPEGAELSPELVLVDPLLAERARAALPEIVLFEDVLLQRRQVPAPPGPPARYAEIRSLWEEAETPPETPKRRPRLVRTPLVVALFLAALLAAGSAALALRPAAPAPHAAHVDRALARTAAAARPAPAARTIPDFVWGAAKGAAAYRVEFARGRHVVLVATAKRPRLHVAAHALAPGRYRWRCGPWTARAHGPDRRSSTPR